MIMMKQEYLNKLILCGDGYRQIRQTRGICQLFCKYSQNAHRSEIMRCGVRGQIICQLR